MKSRRRCTVRIPAAILLLVAAGLAAQAPAPTPATSQARVPAQLTRVVSAAPSWSRDGRKIVFHSNRSSHRPEAYDLFVMDQYGSEVTRLTDHSATEMNAAFSPDGSRIAFVSDRDGI